MKLTAFILRRCPYCLQARELIGELCEEHPAFSSVEIEWIDEAQNAALAEQYDYYRVPSFFRGEEKLYEADPLWSREEAKQRLEEMLDKLV